MPPTITDLDYWAARLHGRRSRLAEARRLDALCQVRSLPELAAAVYPAREFRSALELQRQLVQGLLEEVRALAGQLTGAEQRLLEWMLVRFQVENLKALVRGFTTHAPWETAERHLLSLPRELQLKAQALSTAGSLEEFIRLVPPGPLQESLAQAGKSYGEQAKPLFLEAALDRGYFRELLARVDRMADEHQEELRALVCQEVDLFHLMLVSRGRFYYGLAPALLLPLHVAGTELSHARFAAMLEEPELMDAARHAVGRVIEALLTETTIVAACAELEALAWERYWRLANALFRRSHIGLGTVVGYIGLRRVEVANLITLSEGVRAGADRAALRARLIPRAAQEVTHV